VRERLEARLAELTNDLEVGEKRLHDLEAEGARLRDTLLRISGAAQILRELVTEEAAVASNNGTGDDPASIVLASARGEEHS